MGVSMAAASCFIGLAFLIAFETFSTTIVPLVSDVHSAYGDMMNRKVEMAHTHIEITNVSRENNGTGSYDLTIEIENNGGTTISLNDCHFLLNGIIFPFNTFDTFLFPEESSELHIYHISESGSVRLKLVTKNDIETYYEYYI